MQRRKSVYSQELDELDARKLVSGNDQFGSKKERRASKMTSDDQAKTETETSISVASSTSPLHGAASESSASEHDNKGVEQVKVSNCLPSFFPSLSLSWFSRSSATTVPQKASK